MARRWRLDLATVVVLLTASIAGQSQSAPPIEGVAVRLHLQSKGGEHLPPAVMWLQPRPGTVLPPFLPTGPYALAQKNRMFHPHLLVVPVGSAVHFPNEDPFFHNVFSLFNGKKFDLGLYESGSTKAVEFTREGVSYIFCNIHPEMSAVVLALSSPLYAIAGRDGDLTVHTVPAGDYMLHVWMEGLSQPEQDRLSRQVHVGSTAVDLGSVDTSAAKTGSATHLNKFGQPYDKDAPPVY